MLVIYVFPCLSLTFNPDRVTTMSLFGKTEDHFISTCFYYPPPPKVRPCLWLAVTPHSESWKIPRWKSCSWSKCDIRNLGYNALLLHTYDHNHRFTAHSSAWSWNAKFDFFYTRTHLMSSYCIVLMRLWMLLKCKFWTHWILYWFYSTKNRLFFFLIIWFELVTYFDISCFHRVIFQVYVINKVIPYKQKKNVLVYWLTSQAQHV